MSTGASLLVARAPVSYLGSTDMLVATPGDTGKREVTGDTVELWGTPV